MHTILQKLFYISKCVPTYPGGLLFMLFFSMFLCGFTPNPPKDGLSPTHFPVSLRAFTPQPPKGGLHVILLYVTLPIDRDKL
jgi:hypothetical protein